MSSIVQKIKEVVHSDNKHSAAEGSHGPHNTRAANAADPRVDSDRDGSHTTGTTGTHTGPSPAYHSDNYTHGGTGTGAGLTGGVGGTHAEGTHGSHNSRLANAVDPRIDSDRDGSKTLGGNTYGSSTTGGVTGTRNEGTQGPHDSRLANTLDPRVDSDRDGSRTVGGNAYGSSTTGGLTGTRAEGTHGPHGNRLANAADPRVDSDRDGSRTMGGNTQGGNHTTAGHVGAAIGGTHGTGPAPNTAGPHKSDLMNKVDPRVDSNLDGSKTVGGNQTYSQSDRVDPTDAAQVPPSVLRKHLGEPLIAHEDHTHHRDRRNSVVSHQEQFRGI